MTDLPPSPSELRGSRARRPTPPAAPEPRGARCFRAPAPTISLKETRLHALQDLGWTDSHTTEFEPHAANGRIPARVAAQHRGAYVVFSELGELRADLPAGSPTRPPAPVSCRPSATGSRSRPGPRRTRRRSTPSSPAGRSSRARSRWAPRRSRCSRPTSTPSSCVMSLNEDFNLRRLERYMAMAWESGAQPVIVLTKTDLCPDYALRVLEVEAIAFGVPVHAISSLTGDGLDLIRSQLLPGRTIALLGSSGVGKSTLVNTLAGEELLATQTIREHDGEGRHTTRHRQLVLLPGGGLVVDTPGLRELQLWESSEGSRRRSATSRSSRTGAASPIAPTAPSRAARSGRRSRRDARRRPLGELQQAPARAGAPRAAARQATPVRGAEALDQGRRGGPREHAREGAALGGHLPRPA